MVFECSCCSNSRITSKFVKTRPEVLRLQCWWLLRQTNRHNNLMQLYVVHIIRRTHNYHWAQHSAVFPNIYSSTSCVIKCLLRSVVLLKWRQSLITEWLRSTHHRIFCLVGYSLAVLQLRHHLLLNRREPPIYITGILWRRRPLCFPLQTCIPIIILSSLQKTERIYRVTKKPLCTWLSHFRTIPTELMIWRWSFGM